jgi:hypothetical protein
MSEELTASYSKFPLYYTVASFSQNIDDLE